MGTIQTPDDVIRLAKQLAFMIQALADEMEVDLADTTATVSADGKPLLTLNLAKLVEQAKALQYGELGEGDE